MEHPLNPGGTKAHCYIRESLLFLEAPDNTILNVYNILIIVNKYYYCIIIIHKLLIRVYGLCRTLYGIVMNSDTFNTT